MLSSAYFFGCWREAGHYLWRPGMESVQLPAGWTWAIDGYYVPEYGAVNHVITRDNQPVPAGWTVLSMIDNTVDRRPGSHATFFIQGEHDIQVAVARAVVAFPEVCRRVGLVDAVTATLLRGGR